MDKSVVSAFRPGDYSLVGKDSIKAVERGLANARWYASPVPREEMRALLERKDGPALRDTLIWFGLIFFFGACGYWLWGTGWAVIPFIFYGVLYASTSDSRWHESSHGTAFKTGWLNDGLYEIASFMVLRESTPWRWSHTRHHSDTIVVGRDPEIAVMRPADLLKLVLNFFNVGAFRAYLSGLARHCAGRLSESERSYIPASAMAGIRLRAWIYVLIYAGVIALAVATRSLLPLMYIGLPTFYGAWLMVVYGYTQHAGLAENVLDHRLNCRTVYMNALNRYLYWNMNYHVEHHMFPLVPYHALPRLHELVKADMPPAYPSIAAAYREIIPAVLRQAKDPAYFVRRPLPQSVPRPDWTQGAVVHSAEGRAAAVDGWIEACSAGALRRSDVIRFDHDGATYALYRTAEGQLYATEGACTHGSSHLADGLLVQGTLIECGKHNGRFDVRDGAAVRLPACVGLRSYALREEGGRLLLNLSAAGGQGASAPSYTLRVVSNSYVSAFIKELALEVDPASAALAYRPGEYLQFEIPAYPARSLGGLAVEGRFRGLWESVKAFDAAAVNPVACRRNYSFAGSPGEGGPLRFNVRLALPPRGRAVSAGVGSAYLFGLQPGDAVRALGPFGDFHIRPGEREMVYLGGGAGMAPLRAHLVQLLEVERSRRPISYWYGARSRQELLYQETFARLERQHPNFRFRTALSEPLAEDNWDGPRGFIHDVLRREYLAGHPDPLAVDYYLCGPPAMMRAGLSMLQELGVPPEQIAFDEF